MPSKKPKKKSSTVKKIMQLAISDRADDTWRIVKIMEEVSAANPFAKEADNRKAVIKRAMEEGFDDLTADRLYRACSQTVIPFMNSGQKILRADAHLDAIIDLANKNIEKEIYDRNGNLITKQFDPKTAELIIKAHKVKLDTIAKIQSNLINAHRIEADVKANDSLNLKEADREELEKFVAGELIDAPDVMDKLLTAAEGDVEQNKFYDDLDE